MRARPTATGAIVAIEGPSGSGKTTATRFAARALGGVVLPEAYRRLRPTPSLEIRSARSLLALERRLLGEEARRFAEARTAAHRGRIVFTDTGFFGPITYSRALVALGLAPASILGPLDRTARALLRDRRWGVPDLTIYLDTNERTRRRRIAADPRGHPPALAARHEAAGRFERQDFERWIAPTLGARYRLVNGSGRRVEVTRRVRRAVAARGPRPAPRGLAAELLTLLVRAPPPAP